MSTHLEALDRVLGTEGRSAVSELSEPLEAGDADGHAGFACVS